MIDVTRPASGGGRKVNQMLCPGTAHTGPRAALQEEKDRRKPGALPFPGVAPRSWGSGGTGTIYSASLSFSSQHDL